MGGRKVHFGSGQGRIVGDILGKGNGILGLVRRVDGIVDGSGGGMRLWGFGVGVVLVVVVVFVFVVGVGVLGGGLRLRWGLLGICTYHIIIVDYSKVF